MDFTPMLGRLKRRYNHVPRVFGVYIGVQGDGAAVGRSADARILTAENLSETELIQQAGEGMAPYLVVVGAPYERRDDVAIRRIIKNLQTQHEAVILADMEASLSLLDISHPSMISKLFSNNSIIIRPDDSNSRCMAALAVLAGWFYLADEFEYLPERKGIVPLLIDENELFSFIRRIPFGEVVTLSELAKSLGLQWNEKRIFVELSRLSEGTEVAGHRIVLKDGSLGGCYPGGQTKQKELLMTELVPFRDVHCVDLAKSQWTRTKYRPFTNYLQFTTRVNQYITVRHQQIEEVIGSQLPSAAKTYGTWWQNEKPHAYIWKDAGCKTVEVNLRLQTVSFTSVRREKTRG
jgi:alkylated DNA nucleotide flippase Atl1